MDTKEEIVWILVIEHKYGFNHYANKTEEGMRAALDEYVQEWWNDYSFLGTMPEDPEERISEYFENVEDEWYTFDDTLVGP